MFTRIEEINFDGSIVIWFAWRGLFDVLFEVFDGLTYHIKMCIQIGDHAFFVAQVVSVWLQGKAGWAEFVDIDRHMIKLRVQGSNGMDDVTVAVVGGLFSVLKVYRSWSSV